MIGLYGYQAMPKRKDPVIPVRAALIACPWPGQPAEKIEQLVILPIENQVALNKEVAEITSTATTGMCTVQIDLKSSAPETGPIFDDIDLKLKQIRLPEGAGPIQFNNEPTQTVRAPQASEHTEIFLMELGLEWDRIEDLKAKGAIA